MTVREYRELLLGYNQDADLSLMVHTECESYLADPTPPVILTQHSVTNWYENGLPSESKVGDLVIDLNDSIKLEAPPPYICSKCGKDCSCPRFEHNPVLDASVLYRNLNLSALNGEPVGPLQSWLDRDGNPVEPKGFGTL